MIDCARARRPRLDRVGLPPLACPEVSAAAPASSPDVCGPCVTYQWAKGLRNPAVSDGPPSRCGCNTQLTASLSALLQCKNIGPAVLLQRTGGHVTGLIAPSRHILRSGMCAGMQCAQYIQGTCAFIAARGPLGPDAIATPDRLLGQHGRGD